MDRILAAGGLGLAAAGHLVIGSLNMVLGGAPLWDVFTAGPWLTGLGLVLVGLALLGTRVPGGAAAGWGLATLSHVAVAGAGLAAAGLTPFLPGLLLLLAGFAQGTLAGGGLLDPPAHAAPAVAAAGSALLGVADLAGGFLVSTGTSLLLLGGFAIAAWALRAPPGAPAARSAAS